MRGRVLRRPDQDLRRGELPSREVGDVRLQVRESMGSGNPRSRVLRRRRQAAGYEGRCEEVKPWSLVSYRARGSDERAGALYDGHVVELPVTACGGLELIRRWAGGGRGVIGG